MPNPLIMATFLIMFNHLVWYAVMKPKQFLTPYMPSLLTSKKYFAVLFVLMACLSGQKHRDCHSHLQVVNHEAQAVLCLSQEHLIQLAGIHYGRGPVVLPSFPTLDHREVLHLLWPNSYQPQHYNGSKLSGYV